MDQCGLPDNIYDSPLSYCYNNCSIAVGTERIEMISIFEYCNLALTAYRENICSGLVTFSAHCKIKCFFCKQLRSRYTVTAILQYVTQTEESKY